MAGWSEKFTIPGTTRVTFRGDPAKMSAATLAAVEASSFWKKCEDGFFYQNSGAFEGKTPICDEIKGGAPKPVDDRLVAFVSIYEAEPGPYAAKRPWLQARATFVDDMLPMGLTRAGATAISAKISPYLGTGPSGARFYRLKRRELPVDQIEPVDSVYHRAVFVHRGSMTIVRYLDYPAWKLIDDAHLDDVVTDWQAAVVQVDPGSFPKDAVPAPNHNPQVMALIEEAQRQ